MTTASEGGVSDRPPATSETGNGAAQTETKDQIRGSGLLLIGRLIAVGANLVTQVLIARYLSVTDYGAFGYALSVVALVGGLLPLGFDRAIPRFLPIFEERREPARFLGTLSFVLGLTVVLGTVVTISVIALQGWLTGRIAPDPLAAALLATMIVIAPLEAVDAILTNLFAVFRSTRAIFVRKFLVNPALRLAVVLLLLAFSLDVRFLAAGYVVAALAGLLLYVLLLPALLRRAQVLGRTRLRRAAVPIRQLASYTLPLLTMDLLLVTMGSIDAIMLGSLHGSAVVAEFRVVESPARLNALVFGTFGILFAPAAARFFARNDTAAMRDLYWRSAAWIAVLSFPIFALTFSLAEPLTVFLFDERYRSSGIILALLALGHYIDAAFGANGQTIRIFGGIRETVVVNLVALAAHVLLAVALIPPFGAIGAALAILATYAFYNALKQLVLRRVTGIPIFERAYGTVYVAIVLAAGAVFAVEIASDPPFLVSASVAAVMSLAVLLFGRGHLRLAETFPELMRFPGSRFLS